MEHPLPTTTNSPPPPTDATTTTTTTATNNYYSRNRDVTQKRFPHGMPLYDRNPDIKVFPNIGEYNLKTKNTPILGKYWDLPVIGEYPDIWSTSTMWQYSQ